MLRICILFFSLIIADLVVGQSLLINDNSISASLELNRINDSIIFYEATLLNNDSKPIKIEKNEDLIEFAVSNFIGIGLFSSLYPYAPDEIMTKYKELELKTIMPNTQMKFSGKINLSGGEHLLVSIDYYINSEEGVNSDKISLTSYIKKGRNLTVNVPIFD